MLFHRLSTADEIQLRSQTHCLLGVTDNSGHRKDTPVIFSFSETGNHLKNGLDSVLEELKHKRAGVDLTVLAGGTPEHKERVKATGGHCHIHLC